MKLVYQKVKTLLPNLNEKPIALADFFRIAEQQQIEILELRLKKRGYCIYDAENQQSYLAIKKGLDRLKYLETFAHEIMHVFGCNEFEANALRLVALIPATALYSTDWLNDNPTKYAYQLFRERERLYFLHQI